ncbi:mitochondrial ornithine carrier protein [Balamuthia mandrillaris]
MAKPHPSQPPPPRSAASPPQPQSTVTAALPPPPPFSLRELLHMYSSGMIVGLANAAVFHPIDSLRIRYFFQKKHLGSSSTFFNGLVFNLVSTAVKQMAVFPTQDVLKRFFQTQGYTPKQSQFYSGFISGVGLGLVASPINVIKVPLQASRQQKRTLQVSREVYEKFGLRGFFRGGLGVVLRDTSWSITYFPLYSYFNRHLQPLFPAASASSDPASFFSSAFWHNSTASILAGTVAMAVSYPFDGARLYRQHHKESYAFWYGFLESFKPSASNAKSFTTGLVRVPLATTFCHTLYLFLQHLHGNHYAQEPPPMTARTDLEEKKKEGAERKK